VDGVRIGTSGWSYAEWRGTFFPARLRRGDWFAHYAACFDTVELNSTFYGIPGEQTFRTWASLAPAGFVYAVKAHQDITHQTGKGDDAAETLDLLAARVCLLGEHLGPILYQFPPWLTRDLDYLRHFTGRLPEGFRHVVEFRNRSWYEDSTARLLTDAGVGFCIHDLEGSASPEWVTGRVAYLRLHGPGPVKYKGRYGIARLREMADLVHRLAGAAGEVYVYFNNTHTPDADAAMDALELKQLLMASGGR